MATAKEENKEMTFTDAVTVVLDKSLWDMDLSDILQVRKILETWTETLKSITGTFDKDLKDKKDLQAKGVSPFRAYRGSGKDKTGPDLSGLSF